MVRLALIGDIHFGEFSRTEEFTVPGETIKDETYGGESLQQGLEEILRKEQVKYMLIAGDLTSIGTPQEFYYCEKKILDIASKAEVSMKNIIFCLGNHDINRRIVELSEKTKDDLSDEVKRVIESKYQLLAASSAKNCFEKLAEPSIKGRIPFSGVVETDDFLTIILNTGWMCSQHQEIPHGKLGDEQLKWFEEVCNKYENDPKMKIVLMHHHPMQYSYPTIGLDCSMIEEGSELLEIAGKKGIHMILHGHRHHPRATTMFKDGWKRPISFVCAGSLAVNVQHRNNGDIPNTLHIIEINETLNDIVKLYNYQFTTAQGWIPFNKYCPETPMDDLMFLGKIYTEKEQETDIMSYKSFNGKMEWKNLKESLKFMNYDMLNEKFRAYLSSTHEIFGRFPESVMMVKKGDD